MDLGAVDYEIEGRRFTGYLADGAAAGPAPGILVVHEGGGLTDHARERAAMLGRLGYVAFAMDLFGETGIPISRAREIVAELRADLARLRGRCRAALGVLRRHPSVDSDRLAAIGFCFGGTAALELARAGEELACIVGFHPGLTSASAPGDDAAIRARLLMCVGADDPVVSAEQRAGFAAAMTAAGVDWQLHLYGGVGHSFTNREIDAWNIPGFAYDEAADRRSWAAMCALLDESFG